MKIKLTGLIIAALIIIGLIVLPTGWDDAWTTIPLIIFLGWKIWLILAIVVFFLLWYLGILKKVFKFIK